MPLKSAKLKSWKLSSLNDAVDFKAGQHCDEAHILRDMSKRGATKIVAPETRTIRGSIGRFEKEVRQQCLLNFLRMAGIDSADYDTSRDVINHAAPGWNTQRFSRGLFRP